MLIHGDDVRKEHYEMGATIFFEGDPGDAMFIVESGSVGIVNEVEGGTIRLALKIIEDAGVRDKVRENLKSMDTMIKKVEGILRNHEDPRRNVIIDSEPSRS